MNRAVIGVIVEGLACIGGLALVLWGTWKLYGEAPAAIAAGTLLILLAGLTAWRRNARTP